jgi:hypothetical protein
VRFWWVAALVLFLLGGYLCVRGFIGWRRTVGLVRHGQPVVAVVKQANNEVIERKQPGNSNLLLEYQWRGRTYANWGVLEGRRPEDLVSVNDRVPLRIDPNDPDTWTGRSDPPPLGEAVAGGLIVLGVSLVLLLPAVLARRRVLRTWREGTAADAVVLGRHQTALAPRARAVRCTVPGVAEGRVFTVYAPAAVADAESLPVILPPRRGRPLAVAWFE